MAYKPISGSLQQFARNAAGASASTYYLKGYVSGTDTPLSMGIDATPSSTLAKCALNSRGEPISNDADENSWFIPHFNEPYRLALYASATDADNNTLASAVWDVDGLNLDFDATSLSVTVNGLQRTSVESYLNNKEVADVAAMVAAHATDPYAAGDLVRTVVNNQTSKKGGALYQIKTLAQAALDGDVIDGTGAPNYFGVNHPLGDGLNCAVQQLQDGIVNLNSVGAIPFDSSFDNKSPIELAMDFVGVGQTVGLEGDYYASNIDIPNKPLHIKSLSDRRSLFRTIDGVGDSGYFIAPTTWLNNTSSASERMHWENIGVDGGTKDIAHVVQNFFCLFDNYYVNDGVTYGCHQSALNRDGSAISSTMVNNVYKNIWIQGTSLTGFFIAEDGKSTDWEITGGYVFNGGGVNIDIRTMAGGTLTDVHCYLSPVSARFRKWSTGTRITSNYFENDVEVFQGLDDSRVFEFGPGNHVNTDLVLNFGAVAGPMKSIGNTLTTVNHAYFGAKKFISDGDIYRDSSPFSFSNTSIGNTASMEIVNATIDSDRWSGTLSPSKSMSTKQWLYNETANELQSEIVSSTDASITATFQDLVNSRAYVIEYGVTSRFNTTSTVQIAHVERFLVQRSAGGGAVTVTSILSNTASGSFASGPTISTVNNLDITVTATISGSATPVYGRKYLKIIDIL